MKKRLQALLKLVPLELAAVAAVFLLALLIFSFIIQEAVFEKEDVFDNNVIKYFTAHTSPSLVYTMERITFLGSSTFLLPAYILLICIYIIKRKFSYAIDIAVIGTSSTAMMFALKQVFHRHRPELPILKGIGGYSFPSGHALSSFVFCTILIYLVWKSSLAPSGKYIFMLLLGICPVIIGLSRIILNVHYATDVIGGYCFGTVWVILSFAILRKIRKNKLPGETGAVQ